MNVLVVAPHPDDEVIGVGGTMFKHAQRGSCVRVLTITKGDSEFFDRELVEAGRIQQMKANAILCTDAVMRLDLPSPLLDTIPHWKLVKKIQTAMESFKPQMVYIPHYGDMHIEHRLVAEACMVALRPKEFEDVKILAYEVPSETGWNVPAPHTEFVPNVYVKLTEDEWLMKKRALQAFSTQMNRYPSARSIPAIEALAMYRGSTVGTEAAEAFMLIREQRS